MTPAGNGRADAAGRVADALRMEILDGVFVPGQRLRQEVLAERYGTSRLPVRDALRVLEANGLVTIVANTGAWVARLSLEECQEVYQLRERAEPLLLRMSIPGLDAAVRAQLTSLVELMRATATVEQFLALDRDFHMLTYSGARTTVLGELITRLWNTTQHYRRAFSLLGDPDATRVVHLEHEMLVLAIGRDDVEGAERVLAGHIRSTRLELSRHPGVFHEPVQS
jgi:DNA-binding GntR family transcriptional regulator